MVEGILCDHPEVLVHPARKILNLVAMVVELSDFTDVTQVVLMRWRILLGGASSILKYNCCHQEEALMFVARSPEILSMDPVKVATSLV